MDLTFEMDSKSRGDWPHEGSIPSSGTKPSFSRVVNFYLCFCEEYFLCRIQWVNFFLMLAPVSQYLLSYCFKAVARFS